MILTSLAVLIGTLPFRGLILPILSPYRRIRAMSVAACVMSIAVLALGAFGISKFDMLSGTENIAHKRLYVGLGLATLGLSILIKTLSLRALQHDDESEFLAQEREKEMLREAVIRRIIQAAHSSLDLEEVFQKTVDEMGFFLKADRCFIVHYDEDTKSLRPPTREYRSSSAIPSMLQQPPGFSGRSDWIIQQMCDSEHPILFDPDLETLSEEIKAYLKQMHVQSGLGTGITYGNQCLAILFIHQVKYKRVWEKEEQDIITIAASQVAVAIQQAQLYEEIQRTKKEAERAKEIAEAANRKKSEFLSIMSHELRTPLTAIIGYSEMLEGGYGGTQLTEKQRKYVHSVVISGKHLLDIITDILDVAKIEAGRISLSPEWIEIEPLIDNIKGITSELALKKHVQLIVDVPPDIDGIKADPLRLRQILFNLLSNAIKFNKEGGSVSIKIFKTNDKQWVVCEVKDTGIGIPKDKLPELFKPFSQVDTSYARKQEGTGLGLVLTKHLIELHGGTISVESEEGVGSTFTFRLPVTPPRYKRSRNNTSLGNWLNDNALFSRKNATIF